MLISFSIVCLLCTINGEKNAIIRIRHTMKSTEYPSLAIYIIHKTYNIKNQGYKRSFIQYCR